jgi:hypothetical protein
MLCEVDQAMLETTRTEAADNVHAVLQDMHKNGG